MRGLTINRAAVADGWISMSVNGEIDLATVDELNVAIQEVLTSDNSNLLVDLTDTSFMDSTGLKSLVMAERTFTEAGRSFALAVKPGPIWRLIELSGVDSMLTIVSGAEDLETVARPAS
jgi:anti-anti-sigma factor